MARQNKAPSAPRGPAGGVASGRHQGLRRPGDDRHLEHALHEVSLEDRGEVIEDHLRDRRGSGVPSADISDDSDATTREPRH